MLFIYVLLILISFVFLTFILEFLIYFFSKIFIITKIILSFKVSNGYAGVKLSFKMPVKNQRQYRLNKKRKRANDIRREARKRMLNFRIQKQKLSTIQQLVHPLIASPVSKGFT